MTDTESLRQVAQARAPFSAWLGIVLLFCVFGAIVLAFMGPSPRGNNYEEIRAKKRLEIVKTAHEEDLKALSGYAWIDKAKATVRIPIERAMQLTATELAQKKPAAAGAIAVTGAPAATSTNSPAPPPAATVSPTPKKSLEQEEKETRAVPAGGTNPPGARPGSQPGGSPNAAPSASPVKP